MSTLTGFLISRTQLVDSGVILIAEHYGDWHETLTL
jgi:hypothetical protein